MPFHYFLQEDLLIGSILKKDFSGPSGFGHLELVCMPFAVLRLPESLQETGL